MGHLVRTVRSAPPPALSLGAFISLLPFERPTTALKGEEVGEEEDDLSAVRFVLVPAVPGSHPAQHPFPRPDTDVGLGTGHGIETTRKKREGGQRRREGGREANVGDALDLGDWDVT